MNKKIIKRKVLRTKPRPLPEFKYDIETSVKFLLSCAKQRQFISFIEFNRFYKIPDQDWPLVYPLLYRHLNLVLKYCSENNLPPLSVLVVARDMKNSGKMTQRQIIRLRKAFDRDGEAGYMTRVRCRIWTTCISYKNYVLTVQSWLTSLPNKN